MPRIKLFTTIDGALSPTIHSNCRPTVVVLPSSWIETNSIELIQNFPSCLSASFFLPPTSPDTVGLFSFSRWGRRVKKINASYEAVTGQPVGASVSGCGYIPGGNDREKLLFRVFPLSAVLRPDINGPIRN